MPLSMADQIHKRSNAFGSKLSGGGVSHEKASGHWSDRLFRVQRPLLQPGTGGTGGTGFTYSIGYLFLFF
jgi:hypothetical protein